MTTVLVTGGAGFIGSHVVDELVDEGYSVIVLDNLDEQVHDGFPDYCNSNATYFWGDIRDENLLSNILDEVDVISHQAGLVGATRSMCEVQKYISSNSLGTAVLLDTIINNKFDIDKFVVASTMMLYGEGEYRCRNCNKIDHPTPRSEEKLSRGIWDIHCSQCGTKLTPKPTSESAPVQMDDVYSISKRSKEELVRSVGNTYGFSTVPLRYFTVYGSRQTLDNPYTGVCSIFTNRVLNDEPPVVFEDGNQIRDFVHVSDVARANRKAIEKETSGKPINIGSGDPKRVGEVANRIVDLFAKSNRLSPELTGEYRDIDVRHCYADVKRAENELGFTADTSIKDGIADVKEWAKERDVEDNFEQAHRQLVTRNLIGERSQE